MRNPSKRRVRAGGQVYMGPPRGRAGGATVHAKPLGYPPATKCANKHAQVWMFHTLRTWFFGADILSLRILFKLDGSMSKPKLGGNCGRMAPSAVEVSQLRSNRPSSKRLRPRDDHKTKHFHNYQRRFGIRSINKSSFAEFLMSSHRVALPADVESRPTAPRPRNNGTRGRSLTT